MLPGFNHNVKHRGLVFHVQTEDMGKKAALVITHVFIGGNIIATEKTDYKDIVAHELCDRVVKEIMEEQHKATIKKVLSGAYDTHPLVKEELKKKGIAVDESKSAAASSVQEEAKEKSLDEVILDYLADEILENEK